MFKSFPKQTFLICLYKINTLSGCLLTQCTCSVYNFSNVISVRVDFTACALLKLRPFGRSKRLLVFCISTLQKTVTNVQHLINTPEQSDLLKIHSALMLTDYSALCKSTGMLQDTFHCKINCD